jgi:hypothetical protein
MINKKALGACDAEDRKANSNYLQRQYSEFAAESQHPIALEASRQLQINRLVRRYRMDAERAAFLAPMVFGDGRAA